MRIHWLLSLVLLVPYAQAQKVTLPLWPNGNPEPYNGGAEADITKPTDKLVQGKVLIHMTNVGKPTLAFYPAPANHNTGATVVVFPGGGYRILAYDLEGTEVCQWLNSAGVNCVVAKYRVPVDKRYPEDTQDLEDAQQAVRLARLHAQEWKIDPHRVGVLGFSAGGHLVIVLGNHADFKRSGEPASESAISARPDFVVAIYPAYLTPEPDFTQLAKGIDPSASTPPTFLLQTADDPVHVENIFVYGRALKQLKVPFELHIYNDGGHGYGLRAGALPVTHWPTLVETWMKTIQMIPGGTAIK